MKTVKNLKQKEVARCPVCHANAIEACKNPEKKQTHECPRSK